MERSTTASTLFWKPMRTPRPTIRRRPTMRRPRKSSLRSTICRTRRRTTLPPRSATRRPSPRLPQTPVQARRTWIRPPAAISGRLGEQGAPGHDCRRLGHWRERRGWLVERCGVQSHRFKRFAGLLVRGRHNRRHDCHTINLSTDQTGVYANDVANNLELTSTNPNDATSAGVTAPRQGAGDHA